VSKELSKNILEPVSYQKKQASLWRTYST
jgi:hypothetical protein